MIFETNHTDPRQIKVTLAGADCLGTLEKVDAKGAWVLLGTGRPLWIGRYAAVAFPGLPAFVANVREVDGDRVYFAFQQTLHHTVVEAISPARRKYAVEEAA